MRAYYRIAPVNPATGEVWALMPRAGADDVNRAVQSAHRALSNPAWRNLTATARGKLLFKLADLIRQAAPHAQTRVAVDTAPVMEKELAARAEFIRVQCALARLPTDDRRKPALQEREKVLLGLWRKR